LYTYVRKEAVLSSQIEGTQSSLSDLLTHELGETPGVPVEDELNAVRETGDFERWIDLEALNGESGAAGGETVPSVPVATATFWQRCAHRPFSTPTTPVSSPSPANRAVVLAQEKQD
jgi:Fic family protein